VVLDGDGVLRNQDHVAECGDFSIKGHLSLSIVFLGRLGEDFKDYGRVEGGIAAVVQEFGLAANHAEVRVEMGTSPGSRDAEAGRPGFTGPVHQLRLQSVVNIVDDLVVFERSAWDRVI
jgi:hypothetical protein